MYTFDTYLEQQYGEAIGTIAENEVKPSHLKSLLEEYKEVVVTTIIKDFGIGPFLDDYKKGGNVVTLLNARNNVFEADENLRDRFNKDYSQTVRKELYEKGFKQKRKRDFQENGEMPDGYTGKMLNKDGHTHIEHIVSASEIHNNDEARLFMSDEKRSEMAVNSSNLTYTDGSLNQSKGDKDLLKWMDEPNKKESTKTNAEYYDIDREKATEKYNEAQNYIQSTIKKEKNKYYMKNTTKTSVVQGARFGLKQSLGIFLYEFQQAFFEEMKSYIQKYPLLKSISQKLTELKVSFNRITTTIMDKAKNILVGFVDGFISGFINNIFTVFINALANTTSKNMTRLLNEGFYGFYKGFKLLVLPPEGMTVKEAIKDASKVVALSMTTTLGLIGTEAFIIFLKTTPFAPFAGLIGSVLGGILTGLVSATVVYAIDNFGDIVNTIQNKIARINEIRQISISEIRTQFEVEWNQIDDTYTEAIQALYKRYEQIVLLTDGAYNKNLKSGDERHEKSVLLAEKLGIESEKIMKSEQDVLNFFN